MKRRQYLKTAGGAVTLTTIGVGTAVAQDSYYEAKFIVDGADENKDGEWDEADNCDKTDDWSWSFSTDESDPQFGELPLLCGNGVCKTLNPPPGDFIAPYPADSGGYPTDESCGLAFFNAIVPVLEAEFKQHPDSPDPDNHTAIRGNWDENGDPASTGVSELEGNIRWHRTG